MTPEQMENAINFIVEQQAKFAVDHQLFQEDMVKIQDAQAANEQRMKEIMAVQSVHQEVMEQLTEASANAFKILAELGKAQKQTDERLNILINIVENHISNHNGKH